MGDKVKHRHEAEIVEGIRMDVKTLKAEKTPIIAQAEQTEDGAVSLSLSDMQNNVMLMVDAKAVENVLRTALGQIEMLDEISRALEIYRHLFGLSSGQKARSF